MSNPITIKATRGVWLYQHSSMDELMTYVEQGKPGWAVNMLTIYGDPDLSQFADYLRVGEADVTVTLLPRDEQAAMAVMQLRAKLDKLREAYAEAQREILAQISKYEALTNEVQA